MASKKVVKKVAKKTVAKKTVAKSTGKKVIKSIERVEKNSNKATVKEKAKILKMVADVIDRKTPGFVMVSSIPEVGTDTHAMIGNHVEKDKIAIISASHLELDPLRAMMLAAKACELNAHVEKREKAKSKK